MRQSKRFSRLTLVLTVCLSVPCLVPGLTTGLAAENLRESAVVKAVRKASPAIVNISSEFEVRTRRNPFSGFSKDPFFDSFFKDFFDPYYERKTKRTSLGSGVIIDGKHGYILTNAHVIHKTGRITVFLNDEREFEAKIIGTDPDSDLAVLKIDTNEPLPAVEMGDSDDLMIGETVIAIGNPFGFSNTVTTGVISALHRSIRTEDFTYHDFIQTDASINPGNSGGSLQNINGEVIGINTAIYAKAQGIGFAIPINKAKRVVADLIEYGEVIPVWLGISVQDITEPLTQYFNISNGQGVLVTEIEEGSPASESDIHVGDIIVALGKNTISSTEDYFFYIKGFFKGQSIPVRLLRKGKDKTVMVEASAFPMEKADELALKLMGIRVADQENTRIASRHREGVVITEIRQNAFLAQVGARPGDIIRQIDDVTIKDTDDFRKAVVKNRMKKTVVILLQRENQLYHITIKL